MLPAPGRYDEWMASSRLRTTVLVAVLVLAVLVLGVVAAILFPIFTHQSAGGSGQDIPPTSVAEVSAEGADGRTRTLSAMTTTGEPADLSQVQSGDRVIVRGDGFDAGIGIYVSVCQIPTTPGGKPHPCLGGVPEGAMSGEGADAEVISSAWITDDWAWRAFATHRWDDAQRGSFSVELTLPPAADDALDCQQEACAITTRADHTAGNDRVQDMLLPVEFASE